MRIRALYVVVGIGLGLWGCQSRELPRSEANEHPTVAVTHWTSQTELFMEYPVPVAGETGRAAIHVTFLDDFSPLTEGEAVVELQDTSSGTVLRFAGPLSRPGIFGADIRVDEPGDYNMTVAVRTPVLEDEHQLGTVTVHPADTVLEPEDDAVDEDVTFLKEQQWSLEFATGSVATRALRESLSVPAKIHARTGGRALITAPVSGRVEISSTIPAVGTAVEKGAVLARLIPRSSKPADRASLEFEVTEAIEQHGLAVGQRERAERLVSASALPARRLLEAQAAERTTNARRTAAEASLAQYEAIRQADGAVGADLLFDLRAPLTGVIASSRATRGASVEEGDVLFEVVAVDQVHVVGAVPESKVVLLRELSGAELYVSGSDQPVPLDRLVSVGRVLDAHSRTASVIYELDNRELAWSVGQAVELRLFVTDAASGPAIPESAVVNDGGRPVVFVQTGGESFERRPVTLGAREGGYVHALGGVETGERLVSRGAYLIRLAAMSTQLPEHGHAH